MGILGTVTNAKKSIIDNTFGKLNEGVIWTLGNLFNPQFKNGFDVILYPSPGEGIVPSLSAFTSKTAILSTVVAKFHVQSIVMPFAGLEYEAQNHKKSILQINYPEDVTFQFIESNVGTVRYYLDSWLDEIAAIYPKTGEWVFRDDQQASKKDAIVIPYKPDGVPSSVWIHLRGLKYKGIGELTLGQSESDAMVIDATFAVDNVWWKTMSLASLF